MNPQNYLIPVLDCYCSWLNEWTKADGPGHHEYTIEQFTRTDPEKGLFGEAMVTSVIPVPSASSAYDYVVVINATDGDDGGGCDLIGFFKVTEGNRSILTALIQGFDTNLQFILEDGQFKSLP